MPAQNRTDLETRSRALFDASVAAVDVRVQSRLNVARHAALDAVAGSRWRRHRMPMLTAAAGVAAAALIAVALWSTWPPGTPSTPIGAADGRAGLEDLDIVVASGSDDALDPMRDDVDFYAWVAAGADRTAADDHG